MVRLAPLLWVGLEAVVEVAGVVAVALLLVEEAEPFKRAALRWNEMSVISVDGSIHRGTLKRNASGQDILPGIPGEFLCYFR